MVYWQYIETLVSCNSHSIDVTVYDFCQAMPCQHGAQCLNYIGGYMCRCPIEYYGINCDSEYYFMMYIKAIFAQSTNYKSSCYVNGAK